MHSWKYTFRHIKISRVKFYAYSHIKVIVHLYKAYRLPALPADCPTSKTSRLTYQLFLEAALQAISQGRPTIPTCRLYYLHNIYRLTCQPYLLAGCATYGEYMAGQVGRGRVRESSHCLKYGIFYFKVLVLSKLRTIFIFCNLQYSNNYLIYQIQHKTYLKVNIHQIFVACN